MQIWCFQRFLRGQDVPAWRKQQKTTRRVLPEISDFIDLKRITCPRSRRFIFEAFSRLFREALRRIWGGDRFWKSSRWLCLKMGY
mmetsp:Transcript_69827/g.154002  ORF Transcript_69827/g.154002 Transcript_69827/m.154002 type:complete len:85 (+) Transcript_69827:82-336(+)